MGTDEPEVGVLSTMQDFPLTITHILHHGLEVYSRSEVHTFDGAGFRTASFAAVAERAERLAAALTSLGVGPGDRVGTLMWNDQEHLEAYLAVPCMGAVLHTLNIRLFPPQLAYVINHAEDKVLLVDDSLVPLLARILPELTTVEHIVVVGDADAAPLGDVLRYQELLDGAVPGFVWPELDERSAAAMCYTSGTTGDPKGVVYSHRSTFLHSMSITGANVLGLGEVDRALVIVPMFHVNAWGLPYAAWLVGADLVMPERYLQPEPLCRQIALARPTVSSGVPTIWTGVLQYAMEHPEVDLSCLRGVTAGGTAVPRSLIEGFDSRFGVRLIQGWGMTETSPVCAVAIPPKQFDPGDLQWRVKTGRVMPGVEIRIVAEDGSVQPADGTSLGEIEVRGPWITGAYYRDNDPARFHDGWLRTGDIGTLDSYGFIQISDRSKDVIKSGGEWISSVDLENAIMDHPSVLEASVIGVPDERWEERPLAVIAFRPGSSATIEDLREFLAARVAKWWLPERWAIVEELPKTSVGKFNKRALREELAGGRLSVTVADT